MTTLTGQMIGYALQKPEVAYSITKEINKMLGYTELEINNNRFIELDNKKYLKFQVVPEKERLIEIFPNQYLRLHSDIHTSLYTIEYKTTSYPKFKWVELAPYHIAQLNLYLGFSHHDFGFLLQIDMSFLKSKSQEWSYIWNNYMLLYPIHFNQELFNYSINRIKDFFKLMNSNIELSEIPCPEFADWECNNSCKQYCPNPIDKVKVKVNEVCAHCKQEIRADTQLLIRNGKSFHYTNERGNPYEQCVEAAKKDYKCNIK